MTWQDIANAIGRFFAGLHIDEHSALLIAIGIIIGFLLLGGHRHVRYHYNRFRRWYGDRYRRYY